MLDSRRARVTCALLFASIAAHSGARVGFAQEPPATAFERATVAADIRARINDLESTAPKKAAALKDTLPIKVVWPFIDKPFELREPPTFEQLRAAQRFLETKTQARAPSGEQEPSEDTFGVAGGGILLPSASDLIIGITDFVVERAKDEAVYSFVLRLQRAVDTIPFIQVGLPRSADLIENIDLQAFQTLMPALRSAFVQDLNELPRTIGTPEFAAAVKWDDTTRMYAQGVAVVFGRGLEIRRGKPPLVALAELVELEDGALEHRGARTAVRLVGYLAREHMVAGGKPLLDLVQAPSGRRYFVAFAAHDLRTRENLPAAVAATFLARLAKYQSDVSVLIQQFEAARMLVVAGTETDTARSVQHALAASRSVIQVLNTGWRFVPEAAQDARIATLFADALQLHESLLARDYGAVVTWLVQRPQLKDKIGKTTLRYVTLGASLAAARNSEEVSIALRTAAAPVGSFRDKRRTDEGSRLGVSITAFAGGGVSIEQAELRADSTESGAAFGLALPIGPELSWATGWGALSLFVPILDVGAIASTRLGGTEKVEAAPEVGWNQVLAPGAFLVFGITKTYPIAVGFGMQRVSDLRRRTDGGTADVNRFSLIVAIDATLFHF